jgi:hypothetical protein
VQVEKAIKVRKAKVVLLAPNISSLAGEEGAAAAGGGGGGVQCPAAALVALAQERGVPLIFALSRQKMGKVGQLAAALTGHCFVPVAVVRARMLRLRPGVLQPVFAQCAAVDNHQPSSLLSLHVQLLGQRKRASAFAVLDANGVFEELRRLVLLGQEGRQAWQGSAQSHISGQET